MINLIINNNNNRLYNKRKNEIKIQENSQTAK